MRRQKPTLGAIQAAIATSQRLYGSLTEEERAQLDEFAPTGSPRAKPVQHESTEQQLLTKLARSRWWGPGYRHHEQATWSEAEAHRRYRQGVTQGWPDVTVHIPGVTRLRRGIAETDNGTRIALELKRASLAPKRTVDALWWIAWRPHRDAMSDPTHYGLTYEQARTLRLLHNSGYNTMVAHGADEAIEWLDRICGPEPSEPVDWG